ncbi:MAG: hypothetical protein ACPGJW_00395 [Paracoccaceae bacterium]
MTKVVLSEVKKTKYEVRIVIGKDMVQHIVRAVSPEAVRERIDRAYRGRAKIFSIKVPGRDARTEIWNE